MITLAACSSPKQENGSDRCGKGHSSFLGHRHYFRKYNIRRDCGSMCLSCFSTITLMFFFNIWEFCNCFFQWFSFPYPLNMKKYNFWHGSHGLLLLQQKLRPGSIWLQIDEVCLYLIAQCNKRIRLIASEPILLIYMAC